MEAEEVRRVSRTVKRPLFVYGSPPSSVAQRYGYLVPSLLPSFLLTYVLSSVVCYLSGVYVQSPLSLSFALFLSLSL